MAFTVAANVVTAVGFALLLVAASDFAGGIAGWRGGLLWGLAGFAVFTLAPGLGLPPELPAMPAAELFPRQVWWIGTVAATAAGLALIFLGKSPALAAVGIALLVLPHLVGAPQPASYESPIPEGLHHRFVVAVTVTNLVFWALLGTLAGVPRGPASKPGSPPPKAALPDPARLTLVLGGARSGKSRHAEALTDATPRPGATSPPPRRWTPR